MQLWEKARLPKRRPRGASPTPAKTAAARPAPWVWKLQHLVEEREHLKSKYEQLRAERARLFPKDMAGRKQMDVNSELASTFSDLESSCHHYASLFDLGLGVGDGAGDTREGAGTDAPAPDYKLYVHSARFSHQDAAALFGVMWQAARKRDLAHQH